MGSERKRIGAADTEGEGCTGSKRSHSERKRIGAAADSHSERKRTGAERTGRKRAHSERKRVEKRDWSIFGKFRIELEVYRFRGKRSSCHVDYTVGRESPRGRIGMDPGPVAILG